MEQTVFVSEYISLTLLDILGFLFSVFFCVALVIYLGGFGVTVASPTIVIIVVEPTSGLKTL